MMQIQVACFGVAYAVKIKNNRNAEWQKKLKEQNNYQKQECLVITNDMVSKQSRKIFNWKAPGRDGIQGF